MMCTHACMCAWTHKYMYACVGIYKHTCAHAFVCASTPCVFAHHGCTWVGLCEYSLHCSFSPPNLCSLWASPTLPDSHWVGLQVTWAMFSDSCEKWGIFLTETTVHSNKATKTCILKLEVRPVTVVCVWSYKHQYTVCFHIHCILDLCIIDSVDSLCRGVVGMQYM